MSLNILITSNDKCDQSRNSFNFMKEKFFKSQCRSLVAHWLLVPEDHGSNPMGEKNPLF